MSVIDVRVPESWEFTDDRVVETGLPLVPATPQPDPVVWLNDRILYWTEQS